MHQAIDVPSATVGARGWSVGGVVAVLSDRGIPPRPASMYSTRFGATLPSDPSDLPALVAEAASGSVGGAFVAALFAAGFLPARPQPQAELTIAPETFVDPTGDGLVDALEIASIDAIDDDGAAAAEGM